MANQNYQQTEMDLRTNLQQDVDCRVASVIDDTYDMLKDYNPPAVRNRHEAYGIAADNFTRISAPVDCHGSRDEAHHERPLRS